jgi:ABC-type antimicrobial peptide transport system permease subunit
VFSLGVKSGPSRRRSKDEIVGTAGSTLGVLAGAALAVLMLACVNVAGLLLGRAVARSREISVRAALGAKRWRLARQLLVESLVLAGAGGALGVGLAYGAVWAVTRFGPADMPRLAMIAVDAQVLGLALGATVLSAMLFGLAPALRLAGTTRPESPGSPSTWASFPGSRSCWPSRSASTACCSRSRPSAPSSA